MEASPLAELPDELKLRVLSYLRQRDLCRLARVSREFRRLALDPSLWKRLSLRGDTDAGVVAGLLDRATLLDELRLRGCSRVRPWVERVPDALRSLDLGFSADVDADTVARFVDRCPLLSHVNLEGCLDVDDAAVAALCRLPGLTSINLHQCRRVTADGLVAIARGARRVRFLNVAGIDGVGDRVLRELVQGLSDELVSLELDGEYVTDAGLAHLLQCGQMTSFGLNYADSLTDAGMDTIKGLSLLQRLSLKRGLWLSAEAVGSLFLGGGLRGLVALEFANMPLADAGAGLLADGCPCLKILALHNCWDVTEDGLAAIVARCRNLRHLDLRGLYKVTGASLRKLPACLPRLRILSLECCCQVPDGLPSFLAGRVSGLRVFGYDGVQALPKPDAEDPFVSDAEDSSPEEGQGDVLDAPDCKGSRLGEDTEQLRCDDHLRVQPCTSLC